MYSRRQNLVQRIIKSLNGENKIVSVPSDDLERDQKLIGRMFNRRQESIRISKDESRGLLWFKRKE